MSTQTITDYLTKQIFIEKNIVTFRSLSREFALHVNTAKNELATYHHNAPYQSQQCSATFMLSGTVSRRSRHKNEDEDVGMDMDIDSTQQSSQEEEGDGDEGDDVPETRITLVNENDLDAAKAVYEEVHSIHVYSLSPAPLHDAGLVCDRTEFVRSTDRAKAPDFAATVGRIVGAGIKMGALRKGRQPVPPAAGPSRLKQEPTVPEIKPSVPAKPEVKVKAEPTIEKIKEKPKGNGKLNFFSKPKEATKEAKTKEIEIKREEPAADPKKKMFFSKPKETKAASPAPQPVKVENLSKAPPKALSPAPSVASFKSEKEHPIRGVKRKSSVGLQRESTPDNPAIAKGARIRGRVVISDDEDDGVVVQTFSRRKSRASHTSTSSGPVDSEAEREMKALMDLDDDQVEMASRAPSTVVSSANEQDDEDEEQENIVKQETDIEMDDDTAPTKPKPKKRKAKDAIPVGRNGLKKRKITKSRKIEDEKGYMVTQDYTDWESVDEEAEPEKKAPPKPKAKAKPKAAEVKKEENRDELPPAPAKEKVKELTKKTPAPPKTKPAAKSAGGPKAQKGLMNFFGPTKKTS